MSSPALKVIFEFGGFCADTERRLLLRDGHRVEVDSKAFDLLTTLARNCGRTVPKEELIQTVWNGRTVEENNLSVQISALRKALGEGASEHRYIVTVPGEGYRFVGSSIAPDRAPQKDVQTERTIAVLPFKIMNKRAGVASALGIGIADAVISRLATVSGLIARSTSAVLRYPSLSQTPARAGSELRVDFLLEGTIHRARGRVRVQVQLVQVAAEAVLWTAKFDETLTNIIAVEDSISERVAQALMISLSEGDLKRLRERHTQSIEAHEFYLSGRYHWSQRTLPNLKIAIKHFEQALQADPHYALALSGIAQCYLVLGSYNHLAPSNTFPKAKAAAKKALQINRCVADAHACLAHVNMYFDWDWNSAELRFQEAVGLDSHSATVHHWYGVFLTYRGRFEEASKELRLAEGLDPVSLSIRMARVQLAYFERRFDIAALLCNEVLRIAPNFAPANFWLGTILSLESAKMEDGVRLLQRATTLLGGSHGYPVALGILGHALARSGDHRAAQGLLTRLEKLSRRQYVSGVVPAFVHVGLGQTEKALKSLRAARRQRSDLLVHLGVEPIFDPLRHTRGFAAILRTVGLCGA
jgi:DNA-binding winged helix-turn-helix (wHTH) protein/Tfp pilus assembly protein PilF